MNDAGVIRNRLKINAAIENAKPFWNFRRNPVRSKMARPASSEKQGRNGLNYLEWLSDLQEGNSKWVSRKFGYLPMLMKKNVKFTKDLKA